MERYKDLQFSDTLVFSRLHLPSEFLLVLWQCNHHTLTCLLSFCPSMFHPHCEMVLEFCGIFLYTHWRGLGNFLMNTFLTHHVKSETYTCCTCLMPYWLPYFPYLSFSHWLPPILNLFTCVASGIQLTAACFSWLYVFRLAACTWKWCQGCARICSWIWKK